MRPVTIIGILGLVLTGLLPAQRGLDRESGTLRSREVLGTLTNGPGGSGPDVLRPVAFRERSPEPPSRPRSGAEPPEVAVYVSLDEEHATAVLKSFEDETGIKVRANYDTEDNKTVGLVNKIIAESGRPLADVYWNNECGQTERLRKKGLLDVYVSPAAAEIPEKFKDPEGYWTGFAARARVLIYNPKLVKPEDLPRKLEDLADPKFAPKCAMAKPLTGTTLTHAGALHAAWGKERTEAWLEGLRKNGVRFERGNAQVARIVAEGERAFGMTDTDDVHVQRLDGRAVDQVLLDQGPDGLGALLIPNSVMILKGARNPETARKLVDWLISAKTESTLAAGRSAQVPLRPGVSAPAHVVDPAKVRIHQADWREVASMIETHQVALERRFLDAAPGAGSDSGSGEKGGVASIWFALAALLLALGFVFLALRPRKAEPVR